LADFAWRPAAKNHFLGGIAAKQIRTSAKSPQRQENVATAKEMVSLLCGPAKSLRKSLVFLAVQQNHQGIAQFSWRISFPAKDYTFPWLLTGVTKETIFFLAVQFWPQRKFLAAKIIPIWGSYIAKVLVPY